jgi:hypothetical protein
MLPRRLRRPSRRHWRWGAPFRPLFPDGALRQTPESALETVDYCRELLLRFDDGRLIPFTSPLAPFLDREPGI